MQAKTIFLTVICALISFNSIAQTIGGKYLIESEVPNAFIKVEVKELQGELVRVSNVYYPAENDKLVQATDLIAFNDISYNPKVIKTFTDGEYGQQIGLLGNELIYHRGSDYYLIYMKPKSEVAFISNKHTLKGFGYFEPVMDKVTSQHLTIVAFTTHEQAIVQNEGGYKLMLPLSRLQTRVVEN